MKNHKGVIVAMSFGCLLMLGTATSTLAGSLEPTAAPGPTMHTLDDLYQKLSDMEIDVATIKGNLGVGPRFVDNNNGTVTDTVTGLIWLKDAYACESATWYDAEAYCTSLASGMAGLTDGSTEGQWRLPTKEELQGIGTNPPATWDSVWPAVSWTRPEGPFVNVRPSLYWSGTSYDDNTDFAWAVSMSDGRTPFGDKSIINCFVWPVRGGND